MPRSALLPRLASLGLALVCTACPGTPTAPTSSPSGVPNVVGTPGATPKPAPPSFGPPVFPVARPSAVRPPDPTPTPVVSQTPFNPGPPVPTATPDPTPVEPTLPPPAGLQAYELPTLGVNVGTMHGGKGAGDLDGPTTQLRLKGPVGVCYGAEDQVFIADTGNNKIRVSKPEDLPDGGTTRIGETYAGTGDADWLDGVFSRAKFNAPRGIAAAPNGSIYVTDTDNHCIRKLAVRSADDETIFVTTVAGAIAGTGDARAGYVDGVGTDSRFDTPWGVAIDKDGNAFVSDSQNHVIRKITPALVVTTLAGQPDVAGHKDGVGKIALFKVPKGLVVDVSGDIYVCDSENDCIRKISSSGNVTTLAGVPGTSGFKNGPGEQALFDDPVGIALTPDGSLYVSDQGNQRIRLISRAGVVSTFAGTGSGGDLDGPGAFSTFRGLQAICVDAFKDLYVAEEGNHAIRKILLEASVTTELGTTPGSSDGRSVFAKFRQPFGLARDADGNFYIADTGNNTIRKSTKDGIVTTLAGAPGVGGYADGKGSAAKFDQPRSVAVDADGTVYVADEGNHRIRKIGADGTVTTLCGDGSQGHNDATGATAQLNAPRGVAVGPDGNIYVADFGNHRIRMVTPDGVVTTVAGTAVAGYQDGTSSVARFTKPSGVALDKDGRIYVADFGNNAIRLIAKDDTGVLKVGTFAGATGSPGFKEGPGSSAQFNDPWGLTVDAVGRIFVADYGNSLIRRITPDGTVSTYAGFVEDATLTPVSGFVDGPASDAKFAAPSGVVIDELGYVYVVDSENNCVRRIH